MQARMPARDRFDDEHLLWLKSLLLLMKWVTELHGRRDPARGAMFANRSALSALIGEAESSHG